MYDIDQVQTLLERYVDKDQDAEIIELEEGTLGYGLTIARGNGLKTAIIQERYLNEWSSGHTIRLYNKTPKKYETLIEKHYRESEMQ